MSTAIRPFQENDEPAVIGVWHRSGLAAYRFLPTCVSPAPESAPDVEYPWRP